MTPNQIVVIDIPASVPAEEAAAILSEPLTRGYYLKGTTQGDPMRAVFAQSLAADSQTKCYEDLRAMDLVVEHRKQTVTRIVQALAQNGIHRSMQWVGKTREEL
jgi:hypothetical protein